MNLPIWLARVEIDPLAGADWRRTGPLSKETLVLLLAIVGATGLAVLWVVFFYAPGRKRARRRHSQRATREVSRPQVSAEAQGLEVPLEPRRRRRRRRRRDHRPRNPTLAQTGGLPPLRSGDSGSGLP